MGMLLGAGPEQTDQPQQNEFLNTLLGPSYQDPGYYVNAPQPEDTPDYYSTGTTSKYSEVGPITIAPPAPPAEVEPFTGGPKGADPFAPLSPPPLLAAEDPLSPPPLIAAEDPLSPPPLIAAEDPSSVPPPLPARTAADDVPRPEGFYRDPETGRIEYVGPVETVIGKAPASDQQTDPGVVLARQIMGNLGSPEYQRWATGPRPTTDLDRLFLAWGAIELLPFAVWGGITAYGAAGEALLRGAIAYPKLWAVFLGVIGAGGAEVATSPYSKLGAAPEGMRLDYQIIREGEIIYEGTLYSGAGQHAEETFVDKFMDLVQAGDSILLQGENYMCGYASCRSVLSGMSILEDVEIAYYGYTNWPEWSPALQFFLPGSGFSPK
jgi:hypothetical protein